MECLAKSGQDAVVSNEPTNFCRLYLFRHPELGSEYEHRVVGDGPAELSRRGRAAVLGWLERLKGVRVDAVYSSSQPQCFEPAQGIAKVHELEAHSEPRLGDQAMGEWQGREWDEIAQQDGERVRAFFSEFGEVQPPGGEVLGAAVERCVTWWTEQAPRVAGKTLVLVLPTGLLTGFAAALLGMRLSRCFSLRLPAGGLGVLDVYDNAVHIAGWNVGGFVAATADSE